MSAPLDRRRLLGLLAMGTASVLAGCASPGRRRAGTDAETGAEVPVPSTPAAPPPPLPPVPPPHPAPNQVISHGPTTGRRIALTVDDGTVGRGRRGLRRASPSASGIHLTFSPNGIYNRAVGAARRACCARSSRPARSRSSTTPSPTATCARLHPPGIRDELARNDDWVINTFGITTRPYYRPPFGRHTPDDRRRCGRSGLHPHRAVERIVLRLRGRHPPVPARQAAEVPATRA